MSCQRPNATVDFLIMDGTKGELFIEALGLSSARASPNSAQNVLSKNFFYLDAIGQVASITEVLFCAGPEVN